MDRPRLPLTWTDWASGDWLGDANPMGVMKPALAGSIDGLTRAVGATLGAIDKSATLAPQFMLETILDGARSRLRGRDLVIRNGDGALRLHLDDLRFDLAALPLAVGQLGSIHADASKVSWPLPLGARGDAPEGRADASASGRSRAGVENGALDLLHVEFANVHIRPGFAPVLVTAPIRLRATIGQGALDGFLAGVADKVHVELGDHTATARRPGHESWGHATVEPRVEDAKMRLVATGVSVRSRAMRAPGRGLPAVLVDLPTLPGGMRITRIEVGDHVVHVDALIESLEEPITAQQLATVASLVRVGAPEIDLSPSTP
ncbi:MAG TPA: hypothetical protein VGO03_10730 [Acidimicrobiia bacterium]